MGAREVMAHVEAPGPNLPFQKSVESKSWIGQKC